VGDVHQSEVSYVDEKTGALGFSAEVKITLRPTVGLFTTADICLLTTLVDGVEMREVGFVRSAIKDKPGTVLTSGAKTDLVSSVSDPIPLLPLSAE